MYYSIYVKWKNDDKDKVWLHSCHHEEVKFQVACLLSLNEREQKLEYISIKETDYECRKDD